MKTNLVTVALMIALCPGCTTFKEMMIGKESKPVYVPPPAPQVRPPVTPEQLASADYGQPVDERAARKQADGYLRAALRDYDSARVKWEGLKQWGGDLRGMFKDELDEHHSRIDERVFGYRLDALVNARNAFGGYTGYEQMIFIFQDGRLIAVCEVWSGDEHDLQVNAWLGDDSAYR